MKLAENHPQSYAQLVARIIPIQVQQEIEHKMLVEFTTIIESAPTTIPTEALAYEPASIVDIQADIADMAIMETIKPGPASASPE